MAEKNKWTTEVLEKQDKSELQIKRYVDNIDIDKARRDDDYKRQVLSDITDKIFVGLVDAYKIAQKCVKEVYDVINRDTPTENNIRNLMYDKDPVVFADRITSRLNIFLTTEDKGMFCKNLWTIENTEAISVFNNGMRNIMEREGYAGYRVIAVGECKSHSKNCNKMGDKEYDIADLTGIPPFHPNCECTIEFIKEGE